MDQNSIGMNELQYIEVIDTEDDFVQVLGISQPADGSEIEVTSVEFDDGESFLIDIDEGPLLDDSNGQEDMFVHNEGGLIDTDISNSDLGGI